MGNQQVKYMQEEVTMMLNEIWKRNYSHYELLERLSFFLMSLNRAEKQEFLKNQSREILEQLYDQAFKNEHYEVCLEIMGLLI